MENKIIQEQTELLELQLECKRLNERLAMLSTQQSQKDELIINLKEELIRLETNADIVEVKKGIGRLIRKIDFDKTLENNWEYFSHYYDKANQGFLEKLKSQFPNLTYKDHKLCVYLRLNFSTKDIAPLMNISPRGVEISRYRLRKKLNLQQKQNLVKYLRSFD